MTYLKLLKTIRPLFRKGIVSEGEIGILFLVNPREKYVPVDKLGGLYKVATILDVAIRIRFMWDFYDIGFTLGNGGRTIKKKKADKPSIDDEVIFDWEDDLEDK